jgi:Flp pilus assembly pilin Flp
MNKLKKYLVRFAKCEDGVEFIEVAIVMMIVVVLAAAFYALYSAVSDKVGEVEDMVAGVTVPDLSGGGGGP